MDELKVELFEKTLYYYGAFWAYKKGIHGSEEWSVVHAKFCVLHEVIVSCGLEGEYQEWKKRILEGEGGETREVEREDQADG